MPDFLRWEPKWRCGDDAADKAHRGLVRLANEFMNGLRDEKPEAVLKELLQRMGDQAQEHFREEEKVLTREMAPEVFARYQQERNRLVEELQMLSNGFAGARLGVEDVLPYFRDWITSHISWMHDPFSGKPL